MCIELKITYACGHYEEQLTWCPSLQKKKSSRRNKFLGSYKGMKHCGAVRRERPASHRNCDNCLVKTDGLLSQRVGNGASLVHRPLVDESFRQERLCAARESLREAQKGTLKPKGYGHHVNISSQTSVWVPDYYHHPRTVTATANYARASAPAPPVAPPRAPSRAERSRSFSQGRPFASRATSGQSSRNKEGSSQIAGVSDGSPRSIRKPAKPLPTWKAQSLRHTGRLPQRDQGYDHEDSLPVRGRPFPTSVASRQLPRPIFETYLQAHKEVERLHALNQRPLPNSSRKTPQATTKQTLLASLGLGSSHHAGGEADSDVSFACEAARRIEARAARR
ncbi:hypothetical protein PFICI_00604 [Pestalotiopsis fici W106-1]|uniref:Uncharacterized protein n=1 Tax=Pestalotiopsis fici (strain W106-1 / CGMCC3.15140) TaxID=1229662 RepID=W3XNF1_PESFW|nr:uncharacterized protein PFICI_00604 [Pestalotiopsis fici W106-1]ETS86776.1 hypothetical protein PFICI_00604 [Pestalotiopsis fici W106-1]